MKSADKETKFLKYMLQRRANGELSLYGYERKLFQGAATTLVQRHRNFSVLMSNPFKFHSDLITHVGEPSKPPDPLDPTTVNLFDQSDFVAVTWSEYTTFSRFFAARFHLTRNVVTYNVYMSKKTTLRLSVCAKFDMYVCLRTEKL
jgi:hypothetical protein